MVVGGGAEIYDPMTNTWSPTGSAAPDRRAQTETVLADGKVLIVGGLWADGSQSTLASAVLHDPATKTETPTAGPEQGRHSHSAILLFDGKVLIIGGRDESNQLLTSAEIYDPSNGTWSRTAPMEEPRATPRLSLLLDGSVLVRGGLGTEGLLDSSAVYDPRTDTWTDPKTEP